MNDQVKSHSREWKNDLALCKSISINRLRNHTTISTNIENTSIKVQHPLIMKAMKKLETKETSQYNFPKWEKTVSLRVSTLSNLIKYII